MIGFSPVLASCTINFEAFQTSDVTFASLAITFEICKRDSNYRILVSVELFTMLLEFCGSLSSEFPLVVAIPSANRNSLAATKNDRYHRARCPSAKSAEQQLWSESTERKERGVKKPKTSVVIKGYISMELYVFFLTWEPSGARSNPEASVTDEAKAQLPLWIRPEGGKKGTSWVVMLLWLGCSFEMGQYPGCCSEGLCSLRSTLKSGCGKSHGMGSGLVSIGRAVPLENRVFALVGPECFMSQAHIQRKQHIVVTYSSLKEAGMFYVMYS